MRVLPVDDDQSQTRQKFDRGETPNMTGPLALALCCAIIASLYWLERGPIEGVSSAVWLPFLWMFFAGSRFASQWLFLGAPESLTVESYAEGSPIDRVVFLALILGAVWVLLHRSINWPALIKNNYWVFLLFLFALVSVGWADEPFLSAKRWFKGTGNLVMALVIVTERNSFAALGVVLRRLAYLLLPLSVLFIKYYPDLGRSYHMGNPMFTGVTFQKNSLGQLCMLIGIYFSWLLLVERPFGAAAGQRVRLMVILGVLLITAWLLHMAQSATATALSFAAIAIFVAARLPVFVRQPRYLLWALLLMLVAYLLLDGVFDLHDRIIRLLGRNPDLTDRKPLWNLVTGMIPNPWLGAGYESFWSGERLRLIWAYQGQTQGGGVLQAHNGYIDFYVNQGLIGLGVLAAMILAGVYKIWTRIATAYSTTLLLLTYIVTAVAYNYTEAAFKPLNNVFLLLLFSMLAIDTSWKFGTGVTNQSPRRSGKRGDVNVQQPTRRRTNTRRGLRQGHSGAADDRLSHHELPWFRDSTAPISWVPAVFFHFHHRISHLAGVRSTDGGVAGRHDSTARDPWLQTDRAVYRDESGCTHGLG